MEQPSDNLYLHGFNLLPEFGPVRLMKLAQAFESFKQAFNAEEKELIAAGLEPEIVNKFLAHAQTLNLETESQHLEAEQIGLISFRDNTYPKLLLEIPKPPPLLYYKGSMPVTEELCLAAVGTRKITNYGRTVIPTLLTPLAQKGLVLVSGLAYGVDVAVHQVALAQHKRTIAVLAGGLDKHSLYPPHHAYIAEEILNSGGALLSEYPMGTPNLKHHFVARNRIISGLCPATLIIECDLESGSLITAKHALDQNRTVYAVPGPIYSPQSFGPNNLIKMGAKLITEADDILDDLNLQALPLQISSQDLFSGSPQELQILNSLSREPVDIDNLIKLTGLATAEVTATLTFLEMKGKIKNLGGQQYILSR